MRAFHVGRRNQICKDTCVCTSLECYTTPKDSWQFTHLDMYCMTAEEAAFIQQQIKQQPNYFLRNDVLHCFPDPIVRLFCPKRRSMRYGRNRGCRLIKSDDSRLCMESARHAAQTDFCTVCLPHTNSRLACDHCHLERGCNLGWVCLVPCVSIVRLALRDAGSLPVTQRRRIYRKKNGDTIRLGQEMVYSIRSERQGGGGPTNRTAGTGAATIVSALAPACQTRLTRFVRNL